MSSVGPYHSSHPHIRSTVQIQHLTEKSNQPTRNAYYALLCSPSMITLFDLPTKDRNSPRTMTTWRTKYALNVKNLPYQTVHVELPDVEALAKKNGAAHTRMKSDGRLIPTRPTPPPEAKENLGKMNTWFEGSEGDFDMGNEPCFADAAICAFLWFTRRMVGEDSEEWKDDVSWNDGRWGRYLESFKPYEKLL
ncbi:uncharacterized protein BT62DRAFT_997376 [Guyanagaster necrorhizus]|uniref:Glutathione S-transferase UstS-like C-terminal domain-containing protein n=1 Tax=Guyanagaster necrorhizus TaxID=856835 RepID=A0A9P8AMS5_9AGAR|nr:uncharacterized protein BT62DRAFT_997376 [Guyanagaster necrorhizus MCA 3950]KAG7441200.1 hypothetical protein BT62DRAFT_997376 [Guyanagaster necrorhizus MCA 3950]